MNLVLLALAVFILVALVVVSLRRDPDEAIAERLDVLAEPWRRLAGDLGFGFTTWFNDTTRSYVIRGSRGGRAVTVEYVANDLAFQLSSFLRPSDMQRANRLKVTVHLLGGLPEGIRIRHDPTFAINVAHLDEILVGDDALDEALWIGGTLPTVVRAYVRRDDVRPLLREFTGLGDGALLTEFELMASLVAGEESAQEQVEDLMARAVDLAEALEHAATSAWRAVAERWGLELVLGAGGQPPLVVGTVDAGDVRVSLHGHGAERMTSLAVSWVGLRLPDDFRIVARSKRAETDAPEVTLDYPPLDGSARVYGFERHRLQALLVEPRVAQAVLDVVQTFPSALITGYGVQIDLPGEADPAWLDRGLDVALTLMRRLRRQAAAVAGTQGARA